MEAHANKSLGHVMEGRNPGEMFALVVGAVLTVIGVAGFFVNSDFSTGSSITASTLIVFDVNGWMNVVHLLTGLAGLYVATRAVQHVRQYALAMGVFYLAIAVWGLVATTVLSVLPVNSSDTILHAAIGALALMIALGPDHSET